MKYAICVPFAYKPYFDEFKATLKLPENNCLFVDDTDPVGGIGIMKAHNMGIDFARDFIEADYLIIMSAGIRFGEKGGLDFLKVIEDHPELLVINGAGTWFDEGEDEFKTQALGWHLTAFKMDVFNAIGRWDENFSPYGFDDVDLTLRMKKYFGTEYKVDTFPVDMSHASTSHSIQLAKVEAPSAPRIAYFVEKWGRHPGAWQWDGWAYPFNNPDNNLAFWPPAPNGGKWDD